VSYQISPEAPDEVEVFAGNYLWRFEDSPHLLSAYVVRSNSNVATVGTLGVIGTGTIGGLRYTIPLPALGTYYHSVAVGADYKDFAESIGLQGNDTLQTPISYLMFLGSYSSSYFGEASASHFEIGFNLGPNGFGNTQKEFERKRFGAKPNFAYLRVHADNLIRLWFGTSLVSRLDGQVADSPLISNEEFAGGGIDSVRGYLESERQADNVISGSFEFRSPDLKLIRWDLLKHVGVFAFMDAADMHVRQGLPGTKANALLWSTGLGLRFESIERIQASLVWAYALDNGDRTRAGDDRFHFDVGYEF
jgi:hemolysin activation/secretion protein